MPISWKGRLAPGLYLVADYCPARSPRRSDKMNVHGFLRRPDSIGTTKNLVWSFDIPLDTHYPRPFAEFILSLNHGLRATRYVSTFLDTPSG